MDKVCICQYNIHMKDKPDSIQFRIDKDLKDRFFELSEKKGTSPSNVLRSLIKQAVEKDDTQVQAHDQRLKELTSILKEMLSFIQQMAFLSPDDKVWELYKSSILTLFLDELIGDDLRDADIKGDQYQSMYSEEIKKNWFIDYDWKKIPIKMHLKPDIMDETRKELQKKQIKK